VRSGLLSIVALFTACAAKGPATVELGPREEARAAAVDAAPRASPALAPRRTLWARRMGGRDTQILDSAAIDGSGDIALVGSGFDPDFGTGILRDPAAPKDRHTFLVELDPSGKTRWAKLLPTTDPFTVHIAFDRAGDMFLAGSFATPSLDLGLPAPLARRSDIDVFVAKLDGAGRTLWARHFGGDHEQMTTGLAVDPAGNVVVLGWFSGRWIDLGQGPLQNAGSVDVFAVSLDGDGRLRWARTFGGAGVDQAFALAADARGRVYVGGFFGQKVDFGGGVVLEPVGSTDAFLVALDGDGGTAWARRFGGKARDELLTLAVDGTGSVTFTASVDGPVDLGVGPILRPGHAVVGLDAAGRVRWARPAPVGDEQPFVDAEGHLVVIAAPASGGLLLTTFSNVGAVLLEERIGSGRMYLRRPLLDRRTGTLIVVGEPSGTIDLGTGPLVGVDRDVFAAAFAR
jgi:hypothetical protein